MVAWMISEIKFAIGPKIFLAPDWILILLKL